MEITRGLRWHDMLFLLLQRAENRKHSLLKCLVWRQGQTNRFQNSQDTGFLIKHLCEDKMNWRWRKRSGRRMTVTIHFRATNMSGETPELCQRDWENVRLWSYYKVIKVSRERNNKTTVTVYSTNSLELILPQQFKAELVAESEHLLLLMTEQPLHIQTFKVVLAQIKYQ